MPRCNAASDIARSCHSLSAAHPLFCTVFTIIHIFAQLSLTILIDVIFGSPYRAFRLNREAKNFTDQLRRRSELNRTQRREIETQSSKPLWKSDVVQFVCTLWLNGAS